MTQIGEWLKALPAAKAAIGVIVLVFVAGASVGVATNEVLTEASAVPARVEALEAAVDSLTDRVEVISERSERTLCFVKAIAQNNGPIGPFACD